jgi:ABC-2 type transport system ATP-binding protein
LTTSAAQVATMEGMNTSLVSVRGLCKSYAGRVVVDGLGLDVPEGSVVGLIGANGAGKTTAVECIQGLRRADSGRLRVCGYDPAREPERMRALVGSQLQDSALPDRIRVGEAVRLFARDRRVARAGAQLIEQFGLSRLRRCYFGNLSGGERQRLFLVLALLNEPRLVILDELTQGLDPAARRDVWAAIAQLPGRGTSVLLVTHEMDEAEALCDQVTVMRAGKVLDAGTPPELIGRYADHATVRFTAPDESLLGELRALPGVRTVRTHGHRVDLDGNRACVAHVGGLLSRRGQVPADLDVQMPGLRDALLDLLDTASASSPNSASELKEAA